MSDNRFKIVFDGTLLPGVDINTAKLNLAALYKSEVAAIERLFSGQPVALKRDLSQIDAQAYLQALKNAGIDARIEPEPAIELNLSEVRDHVGAVTEPNSPTLRRRLRSLGPCLSTRRSNHSASKDASDACGFSHGPWCCACWR